jgi:ParB-like chromosome segregation protein Spo0J
VLISDDGQIIAGHGRIEAAKLLQIERVPTLCLSHLSDAERRAYILADNKLTQNAGWDREILALELQGLLDIEFEVDLTGFGLAEIDMILDDARHGSPDTSSGPEDELPTVGDPGFQ